MTNTNIKIHMLISTLLTNIEFHERTRKSNKVKRLYRLWNNKLIKNNTRTYVSMARESDDTWQRMNTRLDGLGVKEDVSLPTTLIALLDMIEGDKKEYVVNPDFFISMIDGQKDGDDTTVTTNTAITLTDILREELGIKPRPKLGFIKQAMKRKEFDDILSKG